MDEIDKLNLTYARAYMDRVRAECLMLKSLSLNALEARNSLQSVSGVKFDALPKSPNAYGDAIPDGLIKVESLEAECSLIDYDLVNHAKGLVRHIKNSKARVACYCYYVDACSWRECEQALGFSKPSLTRFRDNGLLEIAEMEPQARAPRYPAI